jgi:hypothetical protein
VHPRSPETSGLSVLAGIQRSLPGLEQGVGASMQALDVPAGIALADVDGGLRHRDEPDIGWALEELPLDVTPQIRLPRDRHRLPPTLLDDSR